VWIGCDASTKHDSTAIAACTFADGKVKLVFHRIWQPTPDAPLNFEETVEATLLDLRHRFYVRSIKTDPWQMAAVIQRLTLQGLPIEEFAETSGNLTEASTVLYEAIRSHTLKVYPSADIRRAISHAVAVESGRGWKISKSLASQKVDILIALAQAALGAVQQGQIDQHLDPAYCRSIGASESAKRTGGPFAQQDAADALRARRWTPRVRGFTGF
jgi:hypothetical protein